MGNGGISPYSGGSGGRSPLEAMYTIIAVAIVLVFALIVELWKFPSQVWAFFAGIGILGYLCMRFWPRVVKTTKAVRSSTRCWWKAGSCAFCGWAGCTSRLRIWGSIGRSRCSHITARSMRSLRRIASWRHGPATACGGCSHLVEEGSPGPSMHCLLVLI